jgi:hypothetical protein
MQLEWKVLCLDSHCCNWSHPNLKSMDFPRANQHNHYLVHFSCMAGHCPCVPNFDTCLPRVHPWDSARDFSLDRYIMNVGTVPQVSICSFFTNLVHDISKHALRLLSASMFLRHQKTSSLDLEFWAQGSCLLLWFIYQSDKLPIRLTDSFAPTILIDVLYIGSYSLDPPHP